MPAPSKRIFAILAVFSGPVCENGRSDWGVIRFILKCSENSTKWAQNREKRIFGFRAVGVAKTGFSLFQKNAFFGTFFSGSKSAEIGPKWTFRAEILRFSTFSRNFGHFGWVWWKSIFSIFGHFGTRRTDFAKVHFAKNGPCSLKKGPISKPFFWDCPDLPNFPNLETELKIDFFRGVIRHRNINKPLQSLKMGQNIEKWILKKIILQAIGKINKSNAPSETP